MILKPILAGTFKLDGGAMFGVVPKKIWSKLISSDENNLCTWALRCLYIDTGQYKILIDTGMGNKLDAKFYNHYQPLGNSNIIEALAANGIDAETITDVILTHLHFDHCGGAVLHDQSQNPFLSFKNANYWTYQTQWDLANHPNQREKASFLKENIEPLSEVIQFINIEHEYFECIRFVKVSGHTEGMILPIVSISQNKKILFGADLFPSVHHIPLPYVMAYDMQPLLTLSEKETVLEKLIEENIAIYFEHDFTNEIALVDKSSQGKYTIKEIMTLEEYLEN